MESNNNLENQRAIMKEHVSRNNPLVADLLIPTNGRGKVTEGINNNANSGLHYTNSYGADNNINTVGPSKVNNQLTNAMATYFSQSPLMQNYNRNPNPIPTPVSKPMSVNSSIDTQNQKTDIGTGNNNNPVKSLPVYDNIEDIYMKELKNVMALPYTGEYANGIQSLFFLYITDRLSDSVMKSIPENVKKEIRGIVMDFLSMLESY